jgi:integrase
LAGSPPWVFCSEAGTPLDANNVAKVFKRGLKAAGLPLHFTLHGLRHSFASLLLSAQVSPAYVQRQLGHASIKLTVDTYGRWLPIGNKAAIDGLDDEGVLRISAADESRPDTAP